MKRRSRKIHAALAAALLVPGLGAASLAQSPAQSPRKSLTQSSAQSVDLLIRGGTIYPGDAEPFEGDVAVSGDRIVKVGRRLRITATRVIDARGMIVAPGFIDPHTHMTAALTSDDARERLVPAFLLQGVTTAFVGNDGGGPIAVGDLLASAKARPVGINYAAFTGFGTIREKVIGAARRAPSPAELELERGLVHQAMCEGALGLSTGLFYAPQSFSETGEVIALAREAGALGGTYDTHMRDESDYTVGLVAAVDEVIRIGREAQLPVHISHIKALGANVQGLAPTIVAKIEAARAQGVKISAGQYPWDASGTSLVASLVPLWAQDGGRAAMLARFADPALATRLRAGMEENLRRRNGADHLLIVEGAYQGQRLDAVATRLRQAPIEAAMTVIRQGDPATISFNMSEADIATFMRQPWTMTDSDASTAHPRVWGSFARKWAVYTRERHVLTPREFVTRSATTAAQFFGITDRGRLAPGLFADIVVFDPARYAAQATYEQPERPATGVRWVWVNGQLAVAEGKLTGAAAGRALPHPPTPGKCS